MHDGEEAIQLAELSRKFHGMLICVKHASKLEGILARCRVHIPWVLMTDLRGLVPCMEVLGGNEIPSHPPMLMAVHCESNRQVTRATFHTKQWKQICPLMQNKDCTLVTIGSPSKIMFDLIRNQLGPFGMPRLLGNRDHRKDLPKSVTMSKISRSTEAEQKSDLVLSCMETLPADPYIRRLIQTMTQNDLKNFLDAAVPPVYHD